MPSEWHWILKCFAARLLGRVGSGRPLFDPVIMFKILVIQAANKHAEFLINDRLSFMQAC